MKKQIEINFKNKVNLMGMINLAKRMRATVKTTKNGYVISVNKHSTYSGVHRYLHNKMLEEGMNACECKVMPKRMVGESRISINLDYLQHQHE